jgi:alpha-galactosidase
MSITKRIVTVACALVVAVAPAVAATPAATAAAPADSYNGLALTPPMGWNDWSYYQCNIDENLILAQGRALVQTGLAAKGYDTVTTDDCWMAGSRAADGTLQADPGKFPHGMAWLGQQLHALGLKFGIYEDEGTKTCGGYPGTWGHEQQDANTFASWGVDYVKLDGCNVPSVPGQTAAQTYEQAYTTFSNDLVATGRDIVFSDSMPAYFQGSSDWYDTIETATHISNLWREGSDIPLGQETGAQKWAGIVRNYSYNAPLGQYAGPGHWNDPDFLLAGDSGLTTDEMQSQMSLWAEMAAPLISSTDVSNLSPAALSILGNRAIIAVDQDPLGVQGSVVQSGNGYDVLAKPLANGDVAVVLFNQGDTAQTITTTANRAGLTGGGPYRLTDLVTGKRTATTGTIAASVAPHASVMYRVHRGADKDIPPSTPVYVTAGQFAAGTPTTVQVSVGDYGTSAVSKATVALSVPDGWTVTPRSRQLARIPAGGSASTTFQVTATEPPPGRHSYPVVATVRYPYQGDEVTATGELTFITTTPFPDLASAFNNIAITDELDTGPGNFDGGGDSYSAQALAGEAGVQPGDTITAQGATFTWPAAPAGTADNVEGSGATILLSGQGSKLAFLGSEAGFTSDTVTVTYTDGSTSSASVGFPNWCCDNVNHWGAVPVLVTDHRNTPSGPANYGINYDVFYNSIPIDASKTVASVILPEEPAIHVFALDIQA